MLFKPFTPSSKNTFYAQVRHKTYFLRYLFFFGSWNISNITVEKETLTLIYSWGKFFHIIYLFVMFTRFFSAPFILPLYSRMYFSIIYTPLISHSKTIFTYIRTHTQFVSKKKMKHECLTTKTKHTQSVNSIQHHISRL